jgi:hypothetical protein
MKKVFIALAATGITIVAYVSSLNPSQQATLLADAGIAPTHQLTCTVRLDGEARADGIAGNPNLRGYETLTFPVAIVSLPDGGQERTMPPTKSPTSMLVDWASCTVAVCTPAVCNKWGSASPFRVEAKSGRCYRKNVTGNKQNCALTDGGDPGDMPASRFDKVAQCEAVEGWGPACSVILGDNANTDM